MCKMNLNKYKWAVLPIYYPTIEDFSIKLYAKNSLIIILECKIYEMLQLLLMNTNSNRLK